MITHTHHTHTHTHTHTHNMHTHNMHTHLVTDYMVPLHMMHNSRTSCRDRVTLREEPVDVALPLGGRR